MPITVTIAAERSGSVVARGGDSLANSLLDHAGFAFANDWHGPRHRLPTSMDREEQAAIASHAARMLRAARYTVELDPVLDAASADPQRALSLSDQVLALTNRIRGAQSGAELADALAPLLHTEHGVLERVREALEAMRRADHRPGRRGVPVGRRVRLRQRVHHRSAGGTGRRG